MTSVRVIGDRDACLVFPTISFALFFNMLILVFILFIYFLIAPGLRCSVGFSLVVASRGYSLVEVRRLLIAVASLVAQALGHAGFSGSSSWALKHRLHSYGAWTYLLCSMWNPPRSGIESVSPAMAGGFFTTAQPGQPSPAVSWWSVFFTILSPSFSLCLCLQTDWYGYILNYLLTSISKIILQFCYQPK